MGFFGFFSLFDNEQNCKRLSNYSISRPQCMSSQNSIFFFASRCMCESAPSSSIQIELVFIRLHNYDEL